MKNIKKSNKSGFTLIELLATVTLLAIIAAISFVSINAVVKNNKDTQYKNLQNSIKVAARDYGSDNKYEERSGTEISVGLSKLLSDGYLTGPIKNPYTNEEMSDSDIEGVSVIITFDGNNKVTNVTINGLNLGK